MSKSFSFPLRETPTMVLERAQRTAKDLNATFMGDPSKGMFSGGGITGNYRITGNSIDVTITEKPFITPWLLVEHQIKQFFT
ncbi:conserved hypothetical protein [Gammaproteobacteria bacterium]